MKWVTFECQNKTRPGILLGDEVLDLGAAFKRDMEDIGALLRDGLADSVKDTIFQGEIKYPISQIRLCAPVLRPPKIIAIGLNYAEHASEQKKTPPGSPMLFAKASNSVIGPEDIIILPPESKQVDVEVELGVVIKKQGYRISEENWKDYVLGYTVLNDVSARDCQAMDKQWYRAKSFKTFCPLGPVIVGVDEIEHEPLYLKLRLNGNTQQDGNTRDMIFKVPYLVHFISCISPLEPGDVIATGTPSGVGIHRNPPVLLCDGDVVEAEIQGIGILRNKVKAQGETK